MNLDQKIADKLAKLRGRNKRVDALFLVGAKYLVGLFAFTIALFWLDHSVRDVFLAGVAAVVSWVITFLLQLSIHRLRPFDGMHQKPLMKPIIPTMPSFPSAHATIAFSLATAFALITNGVGVYLIAGFYLIAALIAFSRMYVGVHYLSDVIAGAIVGVGVTWGLLQIL